MIVVGAGATEEPKAGKQSRTANATPARQRKREAAAQCELSPAAVVRGLCTHSAAVLRSARAGSRGGARGDHCNSPGPSDTSSPRGVQGVQRQSSPRTRKVRLPARLHLADSLGGARGQPRRQRRGDGGGGRRTGRSAGFFAGRRCCSPKWPSSATVPVPAACVSPSRRLSVLCC